MEIEKIQEYMIHCKVKLVPDAVCQALEEGFAAGHILDGMIQAMDIVGEKFSRGEIFVPEMMLAAKAMKNGLEVLKPYLITDSAESLGTVVIGTVAGDLHDIGKNLVVLLLESAGFVVIDLGVNVPKEKFLEAAEANPCVRIIACSALLSTALPAMEATVKAINRAPWREKVCVMIGGAPTSQIFADAIGADAYTPDAAAAARKAKELVKNL